MLTSSIRFIQLLTGALVLGTMFGIFMGYDPRSLSYDAFVQEHRIAVAGLNVLIPVLGAITILCTLVLAYRERRQRAQLFLLLVAAALFIVSGLVTRLGNQPINAEVITWDPVNAPADWEVLRADWWQYHCLRLMSGIVGYSLMLIAALRRPMVG